MSSGRLAAVPVKEGIEGLRYCCAPALGLMCPRVANIPPH